MARFAYGNDQVASHGDYISLGPDGLRDKAFVSGHFGFDYAKSLMTGRYNFTFLRNPKERIFSLYRYCRSSPQAGELNEIAKVNDFATFLKAAVDGNFFSYVWNNQVWQLSYGFGSNTNVLAREADPEHLLMLAKENMDKMNYVGLVETFENDIGKIFTQIGRPGLEIQRSNITSSQKNQQPLTGKTKKLLEEATEWDQALYDYALSHRSRVD